MAQSRIGDFMTAMMDMARKIVPVTSGIAGLEVVALYPSASKLAE